MSPQRGPAPAPRPGGARPQDPATGALEVRDVVGKRDGDLAGSRRVARRIALRDAKAQPWRMLLVVLLIGLPVFGVALAGTLQLSTQAGSSWEVERRYAGFDGVIERGIVADVAGRPEDFGNVSAEDAAMYFPDPQGQYSDVDAWVLFATPGVPPETVDWARELWRESAGRRAQLPAGVSVHRVETATVEIAVGDRRESVAAHVVDPADTALFGADSRFDVRSGSLADGVLVNRELGRLVAEGDRLTVKAGALGGQSRDLDVTVAGTVVDRAVDTWRWEEVLPLPWLEDSFGQGQAALLVSADSALGQELAGQVTVTDYLRGPVPDDYLDVLAFARAGDRAQFLPLLHQPDNPGAQLVDQVFPRGTWDAAADLLMVPLLFVGALALLETGLLAGAAFSVGARRSRRVGALLAVVGAEADTVAATLRWQGLLCGLAGAVGGGLLGVGVGLGLMASAAARGVVLPPAGVPWPLVLAAMAIGVLSALLAAWIPARAIARQNAWAAVRTSSAAPPPPSRARAVYALVLVAVAVAATAVATVWLRSLRTLPEVQVFFPVYGIVLMVSVAALLAGVLMLIPMAVHLLGRAAGRLPLSVRLAARDADRNRGRTVPVTAAMGAAAAIAVLALTMLAVTMKPFAGAEAALPEDTVLLPVPDPQAQEAEIARMKEENPEFQDEWIGYRGGPEKARELVRRAAVTAELPEVTAVDDVLGLAPTCAVAGSKDCRALALTYPASSQCHMPIPTQEHVVERTDELYGRTAAADLQQSRACAWGTDPFDAGAQGYSPATDPDQTVLVVDPDRPETMPAALIPDAGARAALTEGKVVVYDPEYVSADGTVDLGVYTEDVAKAAGVVDETADQAWSWDPAAGAYQGDYPQSGADTAFGMVENAPTGTALWEPEDSIHPKAYAAPAESATGWRAVVPQHLLPQLGRQVGQWGLSVSFAEDLTQAQWDRFNTVLGDEGLYLSGTSQPAPGLDAEQVLWTIALIAGLVLVTVSGITTGLALSDSRRDGQVMDAVGAAPGTRRRQAAAQAGVAAALGAVLGLVVGVLPAVSMGTWLTDGFAWMPWPQLAVLLFGAPLLAAVLAWLLVPGRMPSRERQA